MASYLPHFLSLWRFQALSAEATPITESIDSLGLSPELRAGALSDGNSALSDGTTSFTAPELAPPLPLVLLDETVPCSLKRLFAVVMGPDQTFITKQHQAHKYWDVSIGQWHRDTGEPYR